MTGRQDRTRSVSVMLVLFGSGRAAPSRVVPCHAVPCRAGSRRVVSGRDESCRVVSCRVESGRVGLGRAESMVSVNGLISQIWSDLD